MKAKITLDDISIRTKIEPGDLGFIIYRHGKLYNAEYNFGVSFEAYVAGGISEFYKNYDPVLDCVWIAEHDKSIVGFLLLMHRENKIAQLRYFYLEPEYRGLGLGKKLMELYMQFLADRDYTAAYLLTTHELGAAASLYSRHGFKLTKEEESTTFGRRLKEQRYDLQLQPQR